ncbi:hypothetical protein P3T22_001238 [Paraburkholderia sp. GAS348]
MNRVFNTTTIVSRRCLVLLKVVKACPMQQRFDDGVLFCAGPESTIVEFRMLDSSSQYWSGASGNTLCSKDLIQSSW